MSAFTKGPYFIHVDEEDDISIQANDVHDGTYTICRMAYWGGALWAESIATAKLFRASPDMYEALDYALGIAVVDDMEYRNVALDKIKAALAKARGE